MGKIGFDNPRAFVEGVRKDRPEVSRNIEKVLLRKRVNKSFSSRKTGLRLCINHTTVKNILNDAELKWKVRRTARI
jgi:transcriptional regulator of aromatic amino acid metabolism